jgi:hypothetical protein
MLENDWLDEEFPPGDAAADDTAWVVCPYCAAEVELALDPGGASVQSYVEDCEVCCRPWYLTVRWDAVGHAQVEARTEAGA